MAASIFSSPPAVRAVVTLVLIENSHRMLQSWTDLRQHYLPTLLGALRKANPVVPIPVLWLTTTPAGDDSSNVHSASAPPRQYNQLPELKFSFTPDNKITSRIINRATELMLDAAAQFQGGPVNLHLFIVAASTPTDGTWGVSVTMPSQIGQSEWRLLGQRMAQLGIHCHMILPAQQDMSSMNDLFATSLELQGHAQVTPWFPTSPEYNFLLAGNPSGSLPVPDPVSRVPALDHPPFEPIEQPLLVPRPPVLRHQSFPQDVQSVSPPPPSPSTPSLVSSLQKFHGLSRKKLYGTQPPRQPFVRDEPVRTKYKSGPTPLSIPVGSPVCEDARPLGKAKVERGRRADRLPHGVGDMSSSTSPGRRSPWNRVSSDVGSSSSSPTASLSYPDYPTSPSASFSPAMPETGFFHDPCSYFSVSPPPPFQPPPPPPPSAAIPQWPPMPKPCAPMSKSPHAAVRRHSQELAHMQSLGAMSSKYRLDGVESRKGGASHKVKDAGDVPFIFSAELEAATAAKLQAALQTTTSPPDPYSGFTSLNYAVAEDAYSPPFDALAQVTPTGLAVAQAADGLGDHGRFAPSSSSLQGWAG